MQVHALVLRKNNHFIVLLLQTWEQVSTKLITLQWNDQLYQFGHWEDTIGKLSLSSYFPQGTVIKNYMQVFFTHFYTRIFSPFFCFTSDFCQSHQILYTVTCTSGTR